MEVSMHMNQNLLQTLHKQKPFSKNPNPISCQLAMQRESGMKTNFYQLLSLNSQNVGFDEIKKAYKTLALQYHPDVCNPPLTKEESTKRFIELRKAYEILSDPNSRRMYDHQLGLEDPFGFRFGSVCMEKTRAGDCTDYPREVWERQLNGLRKRSGERMKKRRHD